MGTVSWMHQRDLVRLTAAQAVAGEYPGQHWARAGAGARMARAVTTAAMPAPCRQVLFALFMSLAFRW